LRWKDGCIAVFATDGGFFVREGEFVKAGERGGYVR